MRILLIIIAVLALSVAPAFAAPCISRAANTAHPHVSHECRVRIGMTVLSLGLGALHVGGAVAFKDSPTNAPPLATVGGVLAGVMSAVEVNASTGLYRAPGALFFLTHLALPAVFATVSGGTHYAQAEYGGPVGRVTGVLTPALALVGQGVHLSWMGHRQ